MPLAATPVAVVANDIAEHTNPLCLSTAVYGKGTFNVYGDRIKQANSQLWSHWIAICL